MDGKDDEMLMKRKMSRKTEGKAGVNIRKRNKKQNKERLATWNVKTMLVAGKMEEIGKVLEEYNIGILALQEIRWKGEGKLDREKYTLFYGGEDKQGSNGTGFMVNKKFREKVIEFKKINGRISYIKIKNNMADITVITCTPRQKIRKKKKKTNFMNN